MNLNNNFCIHDEKTLNFFLIMSVKVRGGGLKALTDVSAKNVSFFWTAPLRCFTFIYIISDPFKEKNR